MIIRWCLGVERNGSWFKGGRTQVHDQKGGSGNEYKGSKAELRGGDGIGWTGEPGRPCAEHCTAARPVSRPVTAPCPGRTTSSDFPGLEATEDGHQRPPLGQVRCLDLAGCEILQPFKGGS
jgi:hypothetical protein